MSDLIYTSGKLARMMGSVVCMTLALSMATAVGVRAASVTFEAESANMIKAPFKIAASATASGGYCVYQPLHSGRPPLVKCYAIYKVRIREAGRYRLWGRALWPSGCANSVDIKMDGGRPLTLGQDGTYNHWHWVELKGAPFRLSAGVHTMVMVNREDGPGLDEFYLTTDEDYVPVGIMHATPGAIVH